MPVETDTLAFIRIILSVHIRKTKLTFDWLVFSNYSALQHFYSTTFIIFKLEK